MAEDDIYTVKQAADMLGVSTETIRRYTNQFGEALSAIASPGRGEARKFTAHDIRMMEWAKRRIRDGGTWKDVQRELPIVGDEELPEVEGLTGSQQASANDSLASIRDSTALTLHDRQITLLERMADQTDEINRQAQQIDNLRAELDEIKARLDTAPEPTSPQETPSFWDRLFGRA